MKLKYKWLEKTVEKIPVISHPSHYEIPANNEKTDTIIEVEIIKLFGLTISNKYIES